MAALKMFASAEDRARSEIDKLEAARERLYSQRSRASQELTKLKTRVPDAELERYLSDPPTNGQAAPAVTASDELREKIATFERAITAADSALSALALRLLEAHKLWVEEQARAIDRQAEQAALELERHLHERNQRLRTLQEWEGAEYMPSANHTRAIVDVMTKAGQAIVGYDVRVTIPKSEALSIRLAELRAQAAQIRSRPVRSHGTARGSSVSELLEQTCAAGSTGLPEAMLRDWFELIAQRAELLWATSDQRIFIERDRQYAGTKIECNLVWRDGLIDPRSNAKVVPVYKPIQVFDQQEVIGGALYAS